MNKQIETLNVAEWVASAPLQQQAFREAVHIVLSAIGSSVLLRTNMVMKGGMLMAIRYNSTRFTRDADFSTTALYQQGNEKELIEELEAQIQYCNQLLSYNTHCTVQSSKISPPGNNRTHPTLKLTIGYAAPSDQSAFRRLIAKQSPRIVEIDFSYNEAVLDVEMLRLSDLDELHVYSLVNLMAEKYRSLLQQPIRKRNRYQDVYDLYFLIEKAPLTGHREHLDLLECIQTTCNTKGIEATPNSLRDTAVQNMAATGYNTLTNDLQENLPEFDVAYLKVREFYENLPWALS
ncbi:MAG: nucleotidyl transferase AbiEii/AbiGii toxin family protein [Burkholderiales bacterium]|uniref:nucleotidyl transferase AbiEii/AbiGii toxin family protein n=1 Tax=Limnobacter sp. TaxID=2003368 RepID=UPI0039BD3C83|nr:nucleotidyl transferase AbiEii/AbiGii toxin family protein [Burkholderiales bacterium]